MNRRPSPLTADRLRAWRKRLRLSQQTAADQLGMSLRQYADYERGHAVIPTPVALACSAIAYGLPPME